MDRLWAIQTEHFYDKLLIVSARDEHQPKNWDESPWDESRFRPLKKIGSTSLEDLEGDDWNEYMKKESVRLMEEHRKNASSFGESFYKMEVDGMQAKVNTVNSNVASTSFEKNPSRAAVTTKTVKVPVRFVDKHDTVERQAPKYPRNGKFPRWPKKQKNKQKTTPVVSTRPVFTFWKPDVDA